VRFTTTRIIYFFQKLFFMKKDLEPAVKIGDSALSSLQIIGSIVYDFHIPSGNDIEVFDLNFPSPLLGASFKADTKILDIWLRMGLGGVIFKTIMKEKRQGNKKPRLQDAFVNNNYGLYNSLGLPGIGIKEFASYLEKSPLWDFKRPLGVSIGGDSEEEYLLNINFLDPYLQKINKQYFYELNISCPNTVNGQTICENPQALENLLKKIRGNNSTTLCVKISPDISNKKLVEIANVCESFDKVIINAGNTQFKKPVFVGVNLSDFSMPGGGLSGTPIFERTLEMVQLLSNMKIPIMATGGISTINHVKLLKESGASLFGMASSLVLDPYCIPKIHSTL